MHQKHAKIARPSLGNYARMEFALVGSTCELMESLMEAWTERFASRYRCLTVTGDHGAITEPVRIQYGKKRFGSRADNWNEYDDRLLGQAYDLALVNGNHYPAARQIVFLDESKAGTLKRRSDQLTDIFAVVYVSGEQAMPQWLQDKCSVQHRPPIMTSMSMLKPLVEGLSEALEESSPRLRALILAGGASSRMGTDKSQLIYQNGTPEVERLAQLCMDAGAPPSISVRKQREEPGHDLPLIEDRFLGLGPAGAICSAFLTDPDAAWLVLACDLPLLNEATLHTLVAARDPKCYATALRAPGNDWPEPLVAIYEPRAYPRLLQFLSLGYSCPRKMLINSNVRIVELQNGDPLMNANTPEDRTRAQQYLA